MLILCIPFICEKGATGRFTALSGPCIRRLDTMVFAGGRPLIDTNNPLFFFEQALPMTLFLAMLLCISKTRLILHCFPLQDGDECM